MESRVSIQATGRQIGKSLGYLVAMRGLKREGKRGKRKKPWEQDTYIAGDHGHSTLLCILTFDSIYPSSEAYSMGKADSDVVQIRDSSSSRLHVRFLIATSSWAKAQALWDDHLPIHRSSSSSIQTSSARTQTAKRYVHAVRPEGKIGS